MRGFCFLLLLTLPWISVAMDTVRVNSVVQLLDSIQSDRLLIIEPGQYSFSDAPVYSALDKSKVHKDVPFATNVRYSSGEGVTLYMIKNVIIRGGGEGADATILQTSDMDDGVLTVLGCENVHLENLSMTHDPSAPGSPEGGIFKISQSTSVSMKDCSLYGRGGVGLTTWRSKGITVTGTTISHCSYGIVDMRDCWTIRFKNCHFTENKACQALWYMSGCTDVKVEGCEYLDNHKRQSRNCVSGRLFTLSRCEMVSFSGNVVRGNECDYLGDAESVRLINSTNELKRNKFVQLSAK